MSETKHTPGPWTCQRSGRNSRMMNKKGWNPDDPMQCGMSVYGKHSRLLTLEDEFAGIHSREEQEANAQLIAAAPDLLAACKEAVASITGGRLFPESLSGDDALMADLLAAIAKAEGKP